MNITGYLPLMRMLHTKKSPVLVSGLLGILVCFAVFADETVELDKEFNKGFNTEFDKEFDKEFELLSDDRPVPNQVVHPSWFKASFLDLGDDLKEAKEANKTGIAVYFGQKDCAYCRTPVSYTHLTLPTSKPKCRSRWSPYH